MTSDEVTADEAPESFDAPPPDGPDEEVLVPPPSTIGAAAVPPAGTPTPEPVPPAAEKGERPPKHAPPRTHDPVPPPPPAPPHLQAHPASRAIKAPPEIAALLGHEGEPGARVPLSVLRRLGEIHTMSVTERRDLARAMRYAVEQIDAALAGGEGGR